VTLFAGSTVPNPKLMRAYRDKMIAHTPEPFEKCNMLPTGCYVCRVDRHHTIAPALRMADPADLKKDGQCTVVRTYNDLSYGLDDLWDFTVPYDNVHCSYAISKNSDWGAPFSSEGCLTVRGRSAPSDQWAKFQSVLSRIGRQRRCDLVLVTGRDLATAAKLRALGQSEDPVVLHRELVCLRVGSDSEEVSRLRVKLGIAEGTYFGSGVRKKLADYQKSNNLPIDGIYTPALDQQLGWNVFASAGTA
jgi:peptidoglycan hydrolase-like protein with peptidoglycan-binding domain